MADLIELAHEYIKKNIGEPFALLIPIFFRRLPDDFVEFYDPAEEIYMRGKVWKIYDYVEGYRCSNCGQFHVLGAIDMTDPNEPKRLSFSEFLELLEKEMRGP